MPRLFLDFAICWQDLTRISCLEMPTFQKKIRSWQSEKKKSHLFCQSKRKIISLPGVRMKKRRLMKTDQLKISTRNDKK